MAVLCDIHGNLPALDAVLADIARAPVDLVVFAGDILPGPMPVATLDRIMSLDVPTRFVMGNGDREAVEAFDVLSARAFGSSDAPDIKYPSVEWVASQLTLRHRDFLAAFESTVRVELDAGSAALCCHGSPRGDIEVITCFSPTSRVGPMIAGVSEDIVVCGHTHRQFDLRFGDKRVLNAGSVGMPYEGRRAAFWLVLDKEPNMRVTEYDVVSALDNFRDTDYPGVDDMFQESLIEPDDPDKVARFFEDNAGKNY
ncbi:MAG TPA: metallophosphoesterase family protein [Chloroflexota bacterium]|nr:metallophosphoesterase family protein [Chloroflexota bacterium]